MVMTMMNFLMSAAEHSMTPVLVLCGVGIMIFVEAWKVSPQALMGDLYNDTGDE